jgi:hypothetical protein
MPDHTFELAPAIFSGPRIKTGFHCHTVNSDGGLTPLETVETYRKLGFQCLCITDHRHVTPTDGLSDSGFICLPSTENGGMPDILAAGVETAVDTTLPLPDRARLLAGQGGFTVAAHPTYCAALPEAYLACENLHALEIYNAYCDNAYVNGCATELWDMVLGQGKRVFGVAGDDAHLNPKKGYYSHAGLAWNEVWAGEFSETGVLAALKTGAFFSTQGPMFERIEVVDGAIRIECSPVKQVRWRTFGHAGFVDHAPDGAFLTHSALPDRLQPRVFVRIELVDHNHRCAWSNPFFVRGAQ